MSTLSTLPIVDLDIFLADPLSPAAVAEAKKTADALVTYGALVIKDSRINEEDNEKFLNLLENYFAQSEEIIKKDVRKEWAYQVGVTPELTLKPKCVFEESCMDIIEKLDPNERPLDVSGRPSDPKTRYYTENGIIIEAEMLSLMYGKPHWKLGGILSKLPSRTWQSLPHAAKYGPHLLGPTSSNLAKYGKENTILAGFHSDLNCLTIHGRARYPGLHIWARNTGKRMSVKIPPGKFMLVQAGKQFEYLTGGYVRAGYHEVVVNDQTIETINRRKVDYPDRPLIRISSTFFWHLSSDFTLEPIHELAIRVPEDEKGKTQYPPIKVGAQVRNEVKDINLGQGKV
ncbi:Clavaminate synthase-like protein [Lentinula edodes]|uniref:Clavaminate synthase-like protein n=1 Tax=Lentinula edodes TaxID=5353 RepID=A0A1Q3E1N7_LENED|nr:Clavaminate synthase-like protein [Lentinula edodes]